MHEIPFQTPFKNFGSFSFLGYARFSRVVLTLFSRVEKGVAAFHCLVMDGRPARYAARPAVLAHAAWVSAL